jgi:hypothetical protein
LAELAVLWFVLTAFVVYNGLKVFKSTLYLFSPALIVSLATWGILVKSYFDFDEGTRRAFLDPDYYLIAMIYAVLCLLAFQLMFNRAQLSRNIKITEVDRAVDYLPQSVLTVYVAAIGLIGVYANYYVASAAGGFAAYYSGAHGSAVDFTQMSAYVHALPTLVWAAMLMGYVAYVRNNKSNTMLLAITLGFAALLITHTFLFGNRNGIIRLTLFIGSAYVFIYRPSFIKALPLIALLGVAVVATLTIAYIRGDTHLGSEISLLEALNNYWERKESSGGYLQVRDEAAGHEFFFNVAVIEASWRTSVYDYGAPYLFVLINFIPRQWWPSKPTEVEFGVPYFELVEQVVGWPPGEGAAPSQLGLTFLSFSWFGCLLWAAFGYACGRAFRRANLHPSIVNLGLLGSILIATVFWGTQGWNSTFFAWLMTASPFFGLKLYAKLTERQRLIGQKQMEHVQRLRAQQRDYEQFSQNPQMTYAPPSDMLTQRAPRAG